MRATDEQLNAAWKKQREHERRKLYLFERRAWLVVVGFAFLVIVALFRFR